MSATREALAWMEETGATAYAAAKKFRLSPATIYAAARRPRCPHCGSYVKPENTHILTDNTKADLDDLLKG